MSAYADLSHIIERQFQSDKPQIFRKKDLEYKYDFGCTALMIAIVTQDESEVRNLLSKGADTRARNKWNQTVLHLSARRGTALSEILDTSAVFDLNITDDFNQTPLITAARSGCLAAVSALLEAFPDVHLESIGTSYSALHWAVIGGHVEIVRAITAHDKSTAHLDSTGWLGRTPLLDAAMDGNQEILAILLNAGCNAFVRDTKGSGVMHLVLNIESVKVLLERGFEINARGAKRRTPIMSMMLRRDITMVKFLADEGADLTLKDEIGWTLLHYALQQRPTEMLNQAFQIEKILQLCIDKGADPHAVDYCRCPCSNRGCSPTSFAMQNGTLKRWTQKLTDLKQDMQPTKVSITWFHKFGQLGLLHTCCQGSLFVQPYQQVSGRKPSLITETAPSYVEELDDSDDSGDGKFYDAVECASLALIPIYVQPTDMSRSTHDAAKTAGRRTRREDGLDCSRRL